MPPHADVLRVNVEALYLSEGYYGNNYKYEIWDCSIVLLREGDRKADVKVQGKRSQQQVGIDELFPLDQRKKLEAFIAAKKRAVAAEAEASDLQEGLEPYTGEAVREAVARRADEAA